jgi:hypothetical protein
MLDKKNATAGASDQQLSVTNPKVRKSFPALPVHQGYFR